ncbi:MAG: hypothetical protein P9L99_02750 [Candidatus Lernaella stagnicola]|nr:hypothetical protein [Candidatus Lernaella stagnicola]
MQKRHWTMLAAFLVILAAWPMTAAAQSEQPWFVMTFRPEVAAGFGNMTLEWDSFGGLLDYKEEAAIESVSAWGLTPEAFFMPTSGRHFIISATGMFGGGNGRFEEEAGEVIDGEDLRFSYWHLAVGLGGQWFLGAAERTNLYLMAHLGGGRMRFSVDYEDEDATSDPLGAGYFDATIGSTYRFASNFVLGGSLALANQRFAGTADSGDFWNVNTSGSLLTTKLSLVLGFAVF